MANATAKIEVRESTVMVPQVTSENRIILDIDEDQALYLMMLVGCSSAKQAEEATGIRIKTKELYDVLLEVTKKHPASDIGSFSVEVRRRAPSRITSPF